MSHRSGQRLRKPFVTTMIAGAVAAGACGGEVVTYSSGAGGASTTTAAGQTTAATTNVASTTTGGGVCPNAVPTSGSACSDSELKCQYDDPEGCESIFATCEGGAWVLFYEQWECNPPGCPPDRPDQRPSCAGYPEDMVCVYDSEFCPGLPVDAVCEDQQWNVYEPLCNPPPPGYCKYYEDIDGCFNDPACYWQEPGCGTDPIPVGGCFAAQPCEGDWECEFGDVCLPRSVDPCFFDDCNACHEEMNVCVPADTPDG